MSNTNFTQFGDYIKHLRLQKIGENGRALSRAEMAKRAGITAQYAMDIENNKVIPAEDKIENIINVLNGDERLAFKLAGKIPTEVLEKAKKEYYGE